MSSMKYARQLIFAASILAVVSWAPAALSADHQKVVRLPLPDGNDFPISSAVTVKAGVDTYFLSGALAPVINKEAPKGSVAAYGDTAVWRALQRHGMARDFSWNAAARAYAAIYAQRVAA